MLGHFEKQLQLFEAKTKLGATIERLTAKGRKYVSYQKLKSELGVDDDMFDGLIAGARKSNRHSNKYIFTDIDDEPAIGITASKRKGKRVVKDNNAPSNDTGHGLAHNVTAGRPKGNNMFNYEPAAGNIPAVNRMVEHRENELWNLYNRHGWRGLDKQDLLPEGWQSMTGTQIVETILHSEFSDAVGAVNQCVPKSYPDDEQKVGMLQTCTVCGGEIAQGDTTCPQGHNYSMNQWDDVKGKL